MNWGQITECGPVRQRNEDWFCVCPDLGLYAVADGMGGHQAGVVASKMALSVLEEYLRTNQTDKSSGRDKLLNGIQLANRAVYQAASANNQQWGMGTTMTACLLDGYSATVANVGDSRALLLREGKLSRLTVDHSLVQELVDSGEITEQEAWSHPRRNVITRALGTSPQLEIDIYEYSLGKNDRLLLCTDGLTGFVSETRISALLTENSDPQKAVRVMVEEAIVSGSDDNVTIIVVSVD